MKLYNCALKVFSTLFASVILVSGSLFLPLSRPQAETSPVTTSLAPSQDTYTDNSLRYFYSNYGDSPVLKIGMEPFQKVYLKFDTSSIPSTANILSAKLSFYVVSSSRHHQYVRLVKGYYWTEYRLTASLAIYSPLMGEVGHIFPVSKRNSTKTVDLESSLLSLGPEINLGIDSFGTDTLYIGSSESTYPPILQITYQP